MLDYAQQFKVLRRIDAQRASPALADYLWEEYGRRKISIDPIFNKPRADVIDPRTGWVDADVPRDSDISDEIVALTSGYALAHFYGGIIREFKTLNEVERARANAKPNFAVQFEGIPDEEVPEEPDEVAPVPRRR